MSARLALADYLEGQLADNNRAYRTSQITREQWTARNRELAAKAVSLGWRLPAVALADVPKPEPEPAKTVLSAELAEAALCPLVPDEPEPEYRPHEPEPWT